MNDEIKNQAVVQVHRLILDLIEIEDVISWADELIVRLDEPPYWLFDLSLANKQPKLEIVRMLEPFEIEVSEKFVFRSFITSALKSLEKNPEQDSFLLNVSMIWQLPIKCHFPRPNLKCIVSGTISTWPRREPLDTLRLNDGS